MFFSLPPKVGDQTASRFSLPPEGDDQTPFEGLVSDSPWEPGTTRPLAGSLPPKGGDQTPSG